MFKRLKKAKKYLGQCAKLMVGIPDYEAYVQHMITAHPEKRPMNYEEFFRNRQQAYYGGGKGRCC